MRAHGWQLWSELQGRWQHFVRSDVVFGQRDRVFRPLRPFRNGETIEAETLPVMFAVAFDPTAAAHIQRYALGSRAVLRAIHAVPEFPRSAIALKLVWYPVHREGRTTLPIWDGDPVNPDARGNPDRTWRRTVTIEPLSAGSAKGAAGGEVNAGSAKGAAGEEVNAGSAKGAAGEEVNAGSAKGAAGEEVKAAGEEVKAAGEKRSAARETESAARETENAAREHGNAAGEGRGAIGSRVVPLDAFLHHAIDSAEELAAARTVAHDPSLVLGDYVVLLGMHVTTKEIPDWVWATFWWHDRPDEGRFAEGRPAMLEGAASHYLMDVAYSAETPRESDGTPHACMNPWLEARFPGGLHSNCLTCHQRAAFGAASFLPVTRRALAADDPYFAGKTTTDFLWTLALEAR